MSMEVANGGSRMRRRCGGVAIAQINGLGDVVATLPMAAAIKQHDPQARIIFIGRSYSRELIESSTLVDCYLDADQVTAHPQVLAEAEVGVFLNPYLGSALGMAAKKAGVPIRVGNWLRPESWRWANRFISQTSRRVQRHRALLNLAYLRPLGVATEYSPQCLSGMPRLDRVPRLAAELRGLLDVQRFNLVLHPKSNGHAREWPARHFERLIDLLPHERVKIFVTGSHHERPALGGVLRDRETVTDLTGRLDLESFIAFLSAADGMVAGSTGPLHIAAGLGIHALGLFCGRDRATAIRWHPLGPKANAISARPVCKPGRGRCPEKYRGEPCLCMDEIAPERVAAAVLSWSNVSKTGPMCYGRLALA